MHFKNYLIVSIIFLFGYLVTNCTDSLVIPPEELNNLPKTTIGIANSSSKVFAPSDTVGIFCRVTDKDPIDTLFSFNWESEFGTFLKTSAENEKIDTTEWIAPGEDGVYDIRVLVSDGISEVADTLTVIVQTDPEKPAQPYNPKPANHSANLGIYQILKWELITSTVGITYDLYFGVDEQPALYDNNLTTLRDTMDNLEYNTQYFWKVVAKRDDTTFTPGSIWTFTTRRELEGGDASKFEFVDVAAGEFTSREKDSLETKVIDYSYKIMKYEVTNSEYKAFLDEVISDSLIKNKENKLYGYFDGNDFIDAGSYLLINMDSKKSRLKFDGSTVSIEAGFEEHPVTMVTWFGARLFAKYYNCKLPTFDEWEKAARGNTGFDYPWGDEISLSNCNYIDSLGRGVNGTLPVGSYNGASFTYNNGDKDTTIITVDSPSQFNCYDMAGNAWEWTATNSAKSFEVAGGSWYMPYYAQYSWQTYAYDAEVTLSYIGFRIIKKD
ncbi:MAG: SUMF1/EgtB/PvdO family nonheme iron enzyme [Melioribacteraceae bacterium]|nr:SUMF1/EgtB/PvdO family nonheme iron enzyme [Melioribacteraceae bacterium]